LFETIEITGQTLANNLIGLFDQYGFKRKIIVYVKNERSNVNTITIALKSIMKCEASSLDESFQRTCFGHVFSKTCQYTTTNERICINLKFVSIKST